jgi:hypothetical protein
MTAVLLKVVGCCMGYLQQSVWEDHGSGRVASGGVHGLAMQEEGGAHAAGPAWKPSGGGRSVATPSVVVMNLR